MDLKELNKLMKIYKINSYLQLSKKVNIPYTTLLDLINGRGDKLCNIKLLADYFNVNISCLIDGDKKIITIDEKNLISFDKDRGYNFIFGLFSN